MPAVQVVIAHARREAAQAGQGMTRAVSLRRTVSNKKKPQRARSRSPSARASSMLSSRKHSLSDSVPSRKYSTEDTSGRYANIPDTPSSINKSKHNQSQESQENEADHEASAATVQRAVRARIIFPYRLDRKKLAERLIFETEVLLGAGRFLNQFMVFLLFLAALNYASNETTKRGIHRNLDGVFNFTHLKEVSSREQFLTEVLPNIAQNSKKFFVLSSKYFEDETQFGATEMIGPMRAFRKAELGLPFSLRVDKFSFTAWIRFDPKFISGYVLRKRPVATGEFNQLSCWGWYMHHYFGPQLHYGAHDYLSHDVRRDVESELQVEVGLSRAIPVTNSAPSMLTVVVAGDNVTFWQNLEHLGTVPLPVPLTDCFNDNEGILFGGSGMEVGVLRYYPGVLTTNLIREIYLAGDTLSDIATGSEPTKQAETEIGVANRNLGAAISDVNADVVVQQDQTESSLILSRVGELEEEDYSSPPAPVGTIHINQTLLQDEISGMGYHSLSMGPYRLTKTSREQDHRFLTGLPSFLGTGVTWTFWYRHIQCSAQTCGVYLWKARDDERSTCWSFWIENDAIWFDNDLGEPPDYYPHHFVLDKYKVQGDSVWRHLAVQLNEVTNELLFFMDGRLAWKGAYGSLVSEADCMVNKVLTLGRTEPLYTLGAEVELFDFRMYVHPVNMPMTETMILDLASAPADGIDTQQRCQDVTSEHFADTLWEDSFGHTCEWYHRARQINHRVCRLPEARTNCPLSCQAFQECMNKEPPLHAYWTWKHIRRIESRSQNGTICIGMDQEKEQLVGECRDWVASGGGKLSPEAAKWHDSWASGSTDGSRGKRIDVTDCDALEEAIDQHCDMETTQIAEFTHAVRAAGGDYTIGVWIKPIGLSSFLEGTDRFFPHIQFYSQMSPPEHMLTLGLWANPNGEFRAFSSCSDGKRDLFENVEINAALQNDWTFVVITRRNSSEVSASKGQWMTQTNLGQNFEASEMEQCLYDEDFFFHAIEVNYPCLISPIMMIPKAVPFVVAQEMYLTSEHAMSVKAGPLEAQKERLNENNIPLVKRDYTPSSALIAPPILFQTRGKRTSDCAYSFSNNFVQNQHDKVLRSKCDWPFECDPEVMEQPQITVGCLDDINSSQPILDITPLDFDQRVGYPEFVQTLNDKPFLYRDNQVIESRDFVDSSTKFAQIVLIFFTPTTGITSALIVNADFSGAEDARLTVQLQHFQILEGRGLTAYLIVQSLVLVCVFFMILDILQSIKTVTMKIRNQQPWKFSDILRQLVDAGTAAMVTLYVAIRIPMQLASAEETDRIIGGMVELPWESATQDVVWKKSVFFGLAGELMDLLSYEENLAIFCNMILMVSLGRIIELTTLHPRLALLTGTISKAMDDLWHAGLLVLLLTSCFAGIASWRFGSEREDFGNWESTMQTQFMMMFGEFPINWQETPELQFYTVFYFVVVFLLVQNFLLAIVVEAYMNVRRANEILETEQEFTTDVYSSLMSHLKAYLHGWPWPRHMGKVVQPWIAKNSVGYQELHMTGRFKDHAAVGRFLGYYSQYEFLEPLLIEDYFPSRQGEEMIDLIERRVASLLGNSKPTLRELAFDSLQQGEKSLNQKRRRRRSPEAEGVEAAGNGINPAILSRRLSTLQANPILRADSVESTSATLPILSGDEVSEKAGMDPMFAIVNELRHQVHSNELQLKAFMRDTSKQLDALCSRLGVKIPAADEKDVAELRGSELLGSQELSIQRFGRDLSPLSLPRGSPILHHRQDMSYLEPPITSSVTQERELITVNVHDWTNGTSGSSTNQDVPHVHFQHSETNGVVHQV